MRITKDCRLPNRAQFRRSGLAFAGSTLFPNLLLTLAALLGGFWPWAALIHVTLFVFMIDELADASAPQLDVEFPAQTWLSAVLALAHFALLILTVRSLAGPELVTAQKLALFIYSDLYMGQVSNANAHELIHRGRRGLSELGKWVYISLLFGHHTSAHRLVHHVHVATPEDPNTARLGEGFYRFALRAWAGFFRAGMTAETALRRRGSSRWPHPYVIYFTGAILWLALSGAIAGPSGIAVHILLAAFALTQLLLSDYVQHYGLIRRMHPDGRTEPMGPEHSWNAPHWLSGHMMLFAPRHSDHNMHPSRPYSSLTLPLAEIAPTLPYSLPAMACLALIPGLWRRTMNPRADRWSGGADWRRAAE